MKPPGDEEDEKVINLNDWRRLSTDFSTLELMRASQLKSGRENQRCLRIALYLLSATISIALTVMIGLLTYVATKGIGHDIQMLPAEPVGASKADPEPSSGPK